MTRRPLLWTTTLALAIGLAGCGDPAPPSDTPSSAKAPAHGGILRVAFDGDPLCIDPHQAGNNTALNVGRQLTDSLTDQDPQSSEIVPWLAERWEISEDSRRFTFHLREGVTFSDGTPLDAAAVKANFEAIIGLGALATLGGTYLSGLESIEVPEPLTLVVSFKQPNAQFLQATSTMSLGLFATSTLQRSSEERCQGALVGSGPFVLDSFTHNQSVKLSHRADYAWPSSLAGHQGRAWLDGIEFVIIPESGVRLGSLLSRQIDVNTGVAVQDEGILEAQGIPFIARPNPGIVFNLAPNESRELLKETAVRQALNKAIDRSELQGIISRYQKPATSALASSTPLYHDLSGALQHDAQGAARLLDEAGWQLGADGIRARDGQRLSFRVDYWQASTPVLELIQQQLRQAGIELRLNKTTISQTSALQSEGDYDLWFFNLTRADPDVLRTVFFASGRNVNKRPFSEVDEVLQASASVLDAGQRRQLIQRASQLLVEQGHILPLYESATVTAFGNQVHGLHYEASTRLQFFDTWLEPR
ncbi:peptide/nickel transport system substrate-binding protein [Pseudomonas sp. BIGb0408]|uniref:Peptide/nickel transport system substrate-binding protein n=1 Tax=Phytopseudomonas flavescens TaxID=29435 RepID=A0A7Y9XMF9_9GAMM|nr:MULTISPECIES: ABC transporter substrate-binding protein [Pseudomonas]MCW2292468.1 peptide/nickel transport system substrate-binding protein [Pseudomonas sp. BIGb0408]NYH72961.1 peptide/nickel transport system substrate-binding protein [Pseudomonas flavescens]